MTLNPAGCLCAYLGGWKGSRNLTQPDKHQRQFKFLFYLMVFNWNSIVIKMLRLGRQHGAFPFGISRIH